MGAPERLPLALPWTVSRAGLQTECDELAYRLEGLDVAALGKVNVVLLARAVREALEILDEDEAGIE